MKILNMVIPILMYFVTITHQNQGILKENVSCVSAVKPIRLPSTSNVALDVGFPTVCRRYVADILSQIFDVVQSDVA